ncbi:hypothetical protein SALB1_3513 [Salinisphaera sp. LB1]|nr:hypothetical protein SALB1_3513 [Salinisphaera sp. LB1]
MFALDAPLGAGRLVPLLDGHCMGDPDLQIIYIHCHHQPARARALIDHVVACLRDPPDGRVRAGSRPATPACSRACD